MPRLRPIGLSFALGVALTIPAFGDDAWKAAPLRLEPSSGRSRRGIRSAS